MESDKLEAKTISKWENNPMQRVLITMELCSPGRRHLATSVCVNALQHFNQYFGKDKRRKANHSIRSAEDKRLGTWQNQDPKTYNGPLMG